ncbi:MAG: hypothetical protein N4A68_01965 [Maledivibacter sp.]|jgi:hypothetical protein|nr:hypothetical protein [Maledivibacter sp.]
MQLSSLIGEGERIGRETQKEFYNQRGIEEKGNRWIGKSISYLEENYPESILTSDFIVESEKVDKDYGDMVSILKGLRDVEGELGSLDE